MHAKTIERYRRWLYNRLPLIGGRLRRAAVEALARDGSLESVRVLAEAVARSGDQRVRDAALETRHRKPG